MEDTTGTESREEMAAPSALSQLSATAKQGPVLPSLWKERKTQQKNMQLVDQLEGKEMGDSSSICIFR